MLFSFFAALHPGKHLDNLIDDRPDPGGMRHCVRRLGTLESIFTYQGKPGHEIVQVYDARFDDPDVYERPWLEGHESNGAPFRAMWCQGSDFSTASPLVPEGLLNLLEKASLLK